MNLLYDFRAFQEFYPRGVSRYVFELFSRVIKRNTNGKNFILLNANKIEPTFDIEESRGFEKIYCTELEYADESLTFDFFINGSSTWLGLMTYSSIDTLYPEYVLKRVKRIVCILYDFVPLLYDSYLPDYKSQVNYLLQCEAMRYVDHIFTISEYVSRSGARYLQRKESDFTNLYGGADVQKFRSEKTGKDYSKIGRTNDIVNISGMCWRKNFDGVTEAFCKAFNSKKIPRDARLVLICSSTDYFEKCISSIASKYGMKYGKNILVTDYITDEQMISIISRALFSIYPSCYEGLGLPILESYSIGTPCIASNVSSTQELVPLEASFNPFDIDDMASKIIQVYNDDELGILSMKFGNNLIKKVNWESSADTMINKLRDLNNK